MTIEQLQHIVETHFAEGEAILKEHPSITEIQFRIEDLPYELLKHYGKTIDREVTISDSVGHMCTGRHSKIYLFLKTKKLIVSEPIIIEE